MPKREKTKDPHIFRIEGKYFFRGTIQGKPQEFKLHDNSFALAKEKKNALLVRAHAADTGSDRISISHFVDEYLKHRQERFDAGKIRVRTLNETKTIIRLHLLPYFSRFFVSEIEAQWPFYSNKYSANYLPNHKKVLLHLLKWAKKKKYVKALPDLEIEPPVRRERVNLTEDEIRLVFPFLSQNVKLLASMCLFMGMRPGEAWALSWDRVDFKRNCVLLTTEDTKTKAAREIPINSNVLKMLQAQRKGSRSAWVFPNQRDSTKAASPGSYCQIWRRAMLEAKISRHVTSHDLRATFELFAHMNTDFSSSQLEAMVGASVDVQKKTYVKMKAEHLRGLENAVEIEGLFDDQTRNVMGIGWDKTSKKKQKKATSK